MTRTRLGTQRWLLHSQARLLNLPSAQLISDVLSNTSLCYFGIPVRIFEHVDLVRFVRFGVITSLAAVDIPECVFEHDDKLVGAWCLLSSSVDEA